ncbi:hypothetical protein N9V91_03435 [Acidimicrobiaceae bacterium]|nr:hypothetical protein [Acidimicrobiaceae bacterium]
MRVGFGEVGYTADLTAQIDNHTAFTVGFTVGFTNDSETTAWLLVFEATRAGAPLPETGSSEGQHFSTHTPFLSHVAFREADPGVDVMATLASSETCTPVTPVDLSGLSGSNSGRGRIHSGVWLSRSE